MKNGRIITISGLDAAGKTTQRNLLLQRLDANSKQFRAETVRLGFTKGIRYLKRKHLKKNKKIGSGSPSSQATSIRKEERETSTYKFYLLLAMLDLILTFLRIRWNRWRGNVIVCTRYVWDNYIYLSLAFPHIEVGKWWFWNLAKKCAVEPDLSIFLSIPAQISYKRILDRRGVEEEDIETLLKREELYKSVEDQAGWIMLSALRPENEIAEEIWGRFQQISP